MTRDATLTWRDSVLLALLALAILAPGLSALPPIDRDESRYAVATSQMLETGDFVDIRFLDQPRYKQPAGIYWLQALAVHGVSDVAARQIWAHRLPSLINAMISVVLTAWMGTLLFGRRVGLVAGLLLAVCLSLNFEARNAKVDASLLAAVMLGQTALLRCYVEGALAQRSRLNAALFWAAQGLGIMLKGPIILILSLSTIAALCLWDRRTAWLKRLHSGWGVLITLAISLPWLIAIGLLTHGEFYVGSVGKNLLGKVGHSAESHGAPFGYHLMTFVLAFWPGALFAAFAGKQSWTSRSDPAVRFLIASIVPTWLVFELVATKLPHYVLPTYPAIACLAAFAALKPGGWRPEGLERWLVLGYALIWLIVGSALAAAAPVLTAQLDHRIDGVAVTAALLAGLLILVTLGLVWRNSPVRAIGTASAAAAIIYANTFGYALPRLSTIWLSPRITAAFDQYRPCPDSRLITTPFVEPSLAFLTAGKIALVADTAAADTLAQRPNCDLALVGIKESQLFQRRSAQLGLSLISLARISGRNYSDGHIYDLTLYRARSLSPISRSKASN